MEELKCPLCKYATVHAVQLQEHFSTLHPDPAIPVQLNLGSTYAGSTHSVPTDTSSTEVYIHLFTCIWMSICIWI
jgi:hypothetical protein